MTLDNTTILEFRGGAHYIAVLTKYTDDYYVFFAKIGDMKIDLTRSYNEKDIAVSAEGKLIFPLAPSQNALFHYVKLSSKADFTLANSIIKALLED